MLRIEASMIRSSLMSMLTRTVIGKQRSVMGLIVNVDLKEEGMLSSGSLQVSR